MRTVCTEELKKNLIEFYKSKPMPISEAAEKFGICIPTAIKLLRNTKRYPKNIILNPNLVENYFENIDTEEKAYFIGLLISDGNVFNPKGSVHSGSMWTSITLNEEDEYILQKFKDEVKVDTKISHDGRGASMVCVRSDKMAKDLEKYYIVPRKTFITRFPFSIDKKFYRHVIRGIIDGDGSIFAKYRYTANDNRNRFLHSISICGMEQLMSEIAEIFENTLGVKKIKVYNYKNKILSEIHIANMEDMKKVGLWIYKDSTIFMKRKRDTFDKFMQHYGFSYDD